MYAYNRLKAKDPHAIIKANTNMLATSLITSLVDLRLVGETTDATKMDQYSRKWLYTSYRLGESTEFLWADTGWNTAQRASFATMINFLPDYYQRPQLEPRQAYDDFDLFRSFDDGTGVWHLGISGMERLKVSPPEVMTNLVERGDALLATLINTCSKAITAELPVPEGWLVFEPLAEQPPDFKGGTLKLELSGDAYRHIILVQVMERPRLLYSLGARRPAMETFDQQARRLQLSVDAVEGALIRFAVYCPEPVKDVINERGESIPFNFTQETNLVNFETRHVPGDVLQMRF